MNVEPTYRWIAAFIASNGYSPNLREISRGTGLKYTTARFHVIRLQARGWLKREPGRLRSIVAKKVIVK